MSHAFGVQTTTYLQDQPRTRARWSTRIARQGRNIGFRNYGKSMWGSAAINGAVTEETVISRGCDYESFYYADSRMTV